MPNQRTRARVSESTSPAGEIDGLEQGRLARAILAKIMFSPGRGASWAFSITRTLLMDSSWITTWAVCPEISATHHCYRAYGRDSTNPDKDQA